MARPGGELATRPLHFIWLLDCSGSMEGSKIGTLNHAIREAIPHMRRVADDNPNASVLVRAITFSSGAKWHIAQPTPIDQFTWNDVQAGGVTDMGKALLLVADEFKHLAGRGLPPVLVLISDGQPTDDFNRGLEALMAQPWGKKAVRIAIGVGQDTDMNVLQKFIGHSEITPLQANNVETLVNYIKWASTDVLKAATAPPSQPVDTKTTTNVPIPMPAKPDPNVGDVW